MSNCGTVRRARVAVCKAVADMDAYQAFTARLLTADANVRNVRAFFAVKRAKFGSELPLPAR